MAFAGDQLTVTLNGVEPSAAGPGSVLCDKPVPTATRFRARIVLLDVSRPVIKGTAVSSFLYEIFCEYSDSSHLVQYVLQ